MTLILKIYNIILAYYTIKFNHKLQICDWSLFMLYFNREVINDIRK